MGYTNADGARQKFTLKERDIETGLDYFLARYYSSTQGRFTSPDEFKGGPEELFGEVDPHDSLFYAEIAEPQSLNKYHYALNNPLRYIDPDGHQTSTADKIWQGVKAVVRGGVDTQIAVDKVAANIVIGASNIGNGAIGGQQIAPLEPSGAVQEVSMHALEVGILVSPLAGKGGPANVVLAESKQTTVVAAEAANARAATAEASEATGALGRSATTRTYGTQGQKTATTVRDPAGSTTYKTTPGRTGGQSTMIVRRDAQGNIRYVKQEARHGTRDFNKPPNHVHYKRPKDRELR
jgi:RHS repeat-associated protein